MNGYGQIYLRKDNLERALNFFSTRAQHQSDMEGVRNSIELIEKILVERRRKFI